MAGSVCCIKRKFRDESRLNCWRIFISRLYFNCCGKCICRYRCANICFSSLHAHNVIIAIIFVIFITILNLRGVTESTSVLAYPVYLFVLALFILIGVGIYNILTGHVSPTLHTPIGTPVAGISLFYC